MSGIRIAAAIEYCGLGFQGWQSQAHGPTLQAVVEEALSRVADGPVQVHCAGRTDAGVHALGQVIHFDPPVARTPRAWMLGGNVHLPPGVAITWAGAVSADFHARFSALERAYRYVILNREARPGLLAGRVTWECRALDAAPMGRAAACLVGEHDFSAYRAVNCQARSPVRTITALEVRRQGEFILLDVRANAFLHHMVRNIAGVLVTIGMGTKPESWAGEVLQARDRRLGGVTADADGLYLACVRYPDAFGIPAAAAAFAPPFPSA